MAALLVPLEERWLEETRSGMGLKSLDPTWAKLEIVLGLAAAALGIRLLIGEGLPALAGGVLFVLGGYPALAGSRSHVYQSQNRQTAYLLQILTKRE